MNNRQLTAIGCSVALLIGALILWMPRPAAAPPRTSPQSKKIVPPPAVLYSAVFHHAAAVSEQADEAERRGKDANALRSLFREQANLSEMQARVLDEVATECVRDVAAQDARAQKVINAFRQRFPPGKLPPGVKLPPPPPELKQLQEERDAIVLHARDRLRLALGEGEFQRFEGFLATRVAPEIKPVALESWLKRAPGTQRNSEGPVPTAGGH